MSHEQMDQQLEQITNSHSDERRRREDGRRQILTQRAKAEYQAEQEKLHRRQKTVYRTAFHVCALVCAAFLIFGISVISGGHVFPGFLLCGAGFCFGLIGSIFDRLGGE